MLDELDKGIIGALQVDGRAPWYRIARALGERERTVSRRGNDLLDRGVVRVTGLTLPAKGVVLGVRCEPGRARVIGRALAQRADTHYCHAVTGTLDLLANIACPDGEVEGLVLDELPALAGCREVRVWPVFRYIRTTYQWRPGLLSEHAESTLLEESCDPDEVQVGGLDRRDPVESTILETLRADGRCGYGPLARLTGLSEATVRRRLDRMRRSGRLLIRAVVDPAALGYPAKAFLRVRAPLDEVDGVAAALAAAPFVRYATRVAGEHQFVVEVAASSLEHLEAITNGEGWSTAPHEVAVSVMTTTFKRSGLETHPRSPG